METLHSAAQQVLNSAAPQVLNMINMDAILSITGAITIILLTLLIYKG